MVYLVGKTKNYEQSSVIFAKNFTIQMIAYHSINFILIKKSFKMVHF